MTAYQGAVSDAQRKALASARVVAAVRTETAAFRRDVKAELTGGRLTGVPGCGAVTATLEQVANRLEALVHEVEQAVATNGDLLDQASRRLAGLLAMLDGGRYPIDEVKKSLDELRSIVIRVNEGSPAAALPCAAGSRTCCWDGLRHLPTTAPRAHGPLPGGPGARGDLARLPAGGRSRGRSDSGVCGT